MYFTGREPYIRFPVYTKSSLFLQENFCQKNPDMMVRELLFTREPFVTVDEVKGITFEHMPIISLDAKGLKALFPKRIIAWRCSRCKVKIITATFDGLRHSCQEELEAEL